MVALDVEDPVQTRTVIFKGDLRAKFQQLFFRKLLTKARIQLV